MKREHDATRKCNRRAVRARLDVFHECGVRRSDRILAEVTQVVRSSGMGLGSKREVICGNLFEIMTECFDG